MSFIVKVREENEVGYIGNGEDIVEHRREAKHFDTREEAEKMRYIVATSVAELSAQVIEIRSAARK